jgi:DNA mismatch repair protein MutS2
MSFAIGDGVHLPGIGTGVIREVRRGGRYVVMVKNTTLVVTAGQIEPAETPKQTRPRRAVENEPAAHDLHARAHVPSSIDLHGRTAIEAEAAVDELIDDAALAGLPTVRIIHGRRGGRVKRAVHARLRQLPSVRAFRIDPTNPGVTIVEL